MNGSPQTVRFGAFEVDLKGRELRKRGHRLRLPEKPFQILELLLDRPGELVTREALQQRVWPGVRLGFDRSLNTAVNTLRRVLDDSPEKPRFIETRSKRGYRFIAPLEPLNAAQAEAAGRALPSVAILPFENQGGDPEMEYLSDGITESIINSLSRLPQIRVMARSTVFRYKGQQIDPRDVGRRLNLGAVLTGRVAQRQKRLIVGTELVDVSNGWRLWGDTYNREPSDIFAVQEEIANEISRKLLLKLTGEEKKLLAKRYTGDVEAYRDYLRGRYYVNKLSHDALEKSLGCYEQAIARDANYALAYAGLADAQSMFAIFGLKPANEVMPRAREAALKAIELDDALAEGHVALASVLKVYDWDSQGAEREYRLALDLNPNYAAAHHSYADHLAATGRTEEALREISKAQELDTLSVVYSMEIAWHWYMARDYERARQQSLKTLEIEPGFTPAQHTMGIALEQTGSHREAIACLKKACVASGGNPVALAALAHAYASAGKRLDARRALGQLLETARRAYVPAYWVALVYAGLGDLDAVFDWLEKGLTERDVWLVWLRREPRFDSVRNDARFAAVLGKIGFPRGPTF
jgi:TolB-like protein/Flp pilus assembly protein TadD